MDLVIRNACLDTTGEPVDVAINAGMITAVAREGVPAGEKEIDAQGGMISPALVEPHFHLENALIWEGALNHSGTLYEAIKVYGALKKDMSLDDLVRRASIALETAIAHGVQWFRSHIDIDRTAQLNLLRGNMAVREKFKDLIDIQLIAFPQMSQQPLAAIHNLFRRYSHERSQILVDQPLARDFRCRQD